MSRYPYPVARIGIIGGGQLGRMMAKAAKKLGFTSVVLDPTPNCPAGQVSGHQILGDAHDPVRLRELAEICDVTTFDIEDIDTRALGTLEREGFSIRPAAGLLEIIQDKLLQKQALARHGIPTSPFVELTEVEPDAFARFGYPLVQKARRGGYDGRGVAILRSAGDLAQRLPGPGLLERFVEADKELAVVVARGMDGDTRPYGVVEMCFRPGANVLEMLLAPARIPEDTARAAAELATRTVSALDGVGIFGVEMFLTRDGALLVNEVAPRTHNSGHYTIEACVTDQFEQHLRAVTGLPLGDPRQVLPAALINLLGEPGYTGRPVIVGLREALAIPGVSVHVYGKASTQPNRKMGHVTVVDADLEQAREKAERVAALLRITGEERVPGELAS